MSKKATDIVAYIGLIGWLVSYFAGTREESKFHLNQGLVLAIVEIVVNILSRFIGILGLLNIAVFIIWLIALIGACKGEEKPAPLVGGIQLLK